MSTTGLSFDEKLEAIQEENGIDSVDDFFGKTLLLQAILKGMDEEEANKFMNDILGMLDGKI